MNWNIKEYALLFLSGIIAFGIDYFKGNVKKIKVITANLLIVISIVFFLVPAIAEHFNLSIKVSCLITWVLSLFNEKLITFLAKYFDKNTDKILKN